MTGRASSWFGADSRRDRRRLGALAFVVLVLAAFAAVLLDASPARAEGSKELASQGGDRGYLMYRTGTATGGSLGGIPLRSDINVYVQAGERLWLGSSAAGVGGGTINYTRPDGTTGTCGANGRINNRAQEVAGPNANNGFTPCAITVGTGQGGVWKVDFVSPDPTTRTNPTAQSATADWTQATGTNWVSAWDITVRNAANTSTINGRVFADYLSLNLGANSRTYTPQFYVQTRDGYRFRYDLNGIDPLGFVFFANNKGFKDSSGNPLYRSVQLNTTTDAFQNGESIKDPSTADTTAEATHKLFVNTPAGDLPASATTSGGSTWLVSSPSAPPGISNFTFSGSEGTSNQTAPGQGGTFRFTADAAAPYKISLDTNRDGTFGNGTDRVFFGTSTAGQNTVTWDGKDGSGTNVAAGTSGVQASVTSYSGEVHFPTIDAENNPSGNVLERLIPTPSDYTVYYNDSNAALTSTGTPPSPLDARSGTSSQGGAHAFSGAYGDHKGIDTWAYGASNTVALANSIQVKSADLEVASNTDNQTNAAAGRQISYTVTVRNNGPSNVTGASFTDNIPSGINSVQWTCRVTTGTGACGAASGTGNNVSTTLDLNSGAVATFTITGTIAADAPVTLTNTASVTRPSDTEDSNTNNNSSTDTTAVNRQPTADNESYTTNEDQTLSVNAPGVLDGDADPDGGQTLTPEVVNGPSNGNVTLNANGSFTYNPNSNYNGTDSFTYRVCDSGTPRQCSEPATVTITVNGVNDSPTAANDSKATDEDTALTFQAGDLTANDSAGPANESGQTLTVTGVGNARNGTVGLQNGRVTFTPAANFNGQASFTYTVSDGQGGTATATVNVTVRAVNDAPDASDDARTTDEDTSVTIPVLANDTDGENNTLSIGSLTQPANGSATIGSDNTVTYTPNADFTGTDTFTYMVGDGNGGMDMATVTVTVAPVNDGPANSVPGRQTINEDVQLVFSLATNNRISVSDPDSGGQPLRLTLSVPEGSGTLTLNEIAGLTFQTGDGSGDRTMTFTGSVADVNNALRGTRFDPAANFNGETALTIETGDQGNTGSGGARTDTDTVPITVSAVDDQPSLSSIPSQTTIEDAIIGPIDFTFGDVETANGELEISVTSSNTSVVPNGNIRTTRDGGNGSLEITPGRDQTGSTTITVTVRDAGGATTSRSFVLTVQPVNDAPAVDLNGDGNGTGYSGTFTEGGGAVPAGSPNALDTADVDSADLRSATVTLTNRPDGDDVESLAADVSGTPITASYDRATGVLTLTGPASEAEFQRVLRTVTYDNTSDNPSTTDRRVEYTVNDGQAGSNTAVSTIGVARTNDPPVADDDSYTTDEDQPFTGDAPGLLGNDADLDGDTLSIDDADEGAQGIQPVSGPQSGTVELRADGSFTYTPRDDFTGTDSFVYRVSDGNGGTDTATVTIRVEPVNDPPVADDDTRQIAEDQVLNFSAGELSQDDFAGPGEGDQTLTVTGVGGATSGTVELRDGRVIFTPDENFNGEASFEYTVSDGEGGTDTGAVTVNVTPINDLPVAVNDMAATDEEVAVVIEVLDNDAAGPANEDGQTLTVTEISDIPSNGTASVNNDNTITYTPDADFSGTDNFGYRICDSGDPRRCDTAVVTVTVDPVNDGPAAERDVYEINEDQTLDVDAADGLLGNDTDIDGGDLVIVDADENVPGVQPVSGPQSGTLTLNEDGSFSYNPNPGFSGADEFTYRVSDGNGGTDTATATISTNEINDPPEADDDSLAIAEDGTLEVAAPGILDGDTDADNDTLAVEDADPDTGGVQPVTGVRHGTLTLRADGSFTYTPDPDFYGVDSFVYRLSDGRGGTDRATVRLVVDPVNDAPVAESDRRTIPEDQVLSFPVDELTQNDSAGPGEGDQTLTVRRVFGARDGTVELRDGRVTFTPDRNFFGEASFSYEVCDSGNPEECVTTEVNIVDVTPINDPAEAAGDGATTDEDTPVDINVRANDSVGPANEDDQTLTVTQITARPGNGTVSINGGDNVTYTPRADFNGTDTFEYRVCDSGDPSRCDDAVVTVTVNAVNDGPTSAVPDRIQRTNEEKPVVFSPVNGNAVSVSDPDARDSDVTVEVSVPENTGTLTLGGTSGVTVEGDGSRVVTIAGPVDAVNAALEGLRFDPAENFNGPVTLTISTDDGGNIGSGGALTDRDTVEIEVAGINDAPTVDAIEDRSTQEDAATGAVEFGVGDVETDAGEITVTATSSNTDLVPNRNIELGGSGANRTINVTPAPNRSGTTTITLTVRDAAGVETIEAFVLTVEPVNDEPVNGVPDEQETDEDSPLVFSPGNDNRISISDPDADDGEVRVTLGVPREAGVLTVGAQTGVEVTGSGTNNVVLTGTVADIDAALDGLRFDPAPDTNGPVTLTIGTDDGGNTGSGGALRDEDTVEIRVRAANDAPTFGLPEGPRQTVEEDAGPQTVADFATDVSPGPNEDQGLRFRVTDDNGDLFAADGRPAVSPDGTLTYATAPNANGVATVTVVAIDDAGTPDDPSDDVESEPRTFTITVDPVNDAPTISAIDDTTVDEDGTAGPIDLDVGDVETAVGVLTLSATSSNPDLVPASNVKFGGGGANRTVSVEPAADRSGTATITVRVRDAQGRETTETFTITVEPVNDAPTAENDARITDEDTALVFTASALTGNDSAGPEEGDQSLTVTRVGNARNGTVNLRNGQITFTPDPDFNGEASFEYTVADGQGGTASATVTVAVSGVNDAPTLDLNGAGAGTGYSGSFTEGDDPASAVGPDTLDVADVDGEQLRSATVTLTNRPDGAAERLDAYTNGTGISADYDPDTGILTLTGPASAAQFRQVLRAVTYVNASQNPTEGERQIDLTVDDGDRSSERATSTVAVAAVNDAPEIVLPGGPPVFDEGGEPVVVDIGATVADPDSPNFGGGRLAVELTGGATASDRLEILAGGEISLEGNVVSYNGDAIGTFSGGDGPDPLVVTFNESATPEAVQALVRSIAFSVDSDSPSEEPRTVRFVVTDGDGGRSEAATKRINVTGSNDAPVVDLNGTAGGLDSTRTFTEDGGPVAVGDAGALSVADSDDAEIEGATVTLTDRPDGDAAETLAADVSGTPITADYDRATGVLTLTGSASKAAYRDVLRTVTYDNSSQNPTTTARRVEFVINDGDLEAETAVGTVRVLSAPDAPEAANEAARAEEGGDPIVVNVLANDEDAENDNLTVTEVTQPPAGEGTVEIVSDGPDAGTIRFTPDADFGGETAFTYTVSDGNGGTSTATVTVTVAPTNDPPTARDDELNAPEDSDAVRIDVLGNDTDDPDTDETLTVTRAGATSGGGTVEIIDNGAAVRYRPARNFAGTETFEYTISDGNGATSTATVTVIVGGDNDAPEIGNVGGSVSYTENEPAVLVAPGATVDDPDSTDLGGGQLTVALTDNAQPGGRLAVRNVGDGQGEIGVNGQTVSYAGTPIGTVSGGDTHDDPLVISLNEGATPVAVQALMRNVVYRNVSENPAGQVRRVSFTLTDGDGGTGTARKGLAVVPVNDAPVVEFTRAPEAADEGEVVTYQFSVTDPDSESFTAADGSPGCGQGGELVEGSLSTTPSGGSFRCRFPDGPANPTVSIQVEDPQGAQSNTASQAVEVENVAPQADGDGPYEATEDTNLEVSAADGVLSGDTDAGEDGLEATLVRGPSEDAGELTLNPDGSFVFRPAGGFNGRASFVYRACEVGGGGEICSDEIQVNINVAAVNDAPTAEDDASTVREDGSVRVDVTNNDADPDGEGDLDPASVRVISGPDNGQATANGDGSVTYEPRAEFNGTDSFVYEVCDRAGECARATATVTVEPVNDAPVARDDVVATSEDTPLRIPQADLLDNDASGPPNEDGQALRITSVSGARNGTVRLADDGTVVFTPDPGYNGPASFVYTVTDGQGNTDRATANVDVDVSSVNDEPVGEADEATTGEDEPVTIDVLANDTDPENDTLSVVEGSLTQPENGTVEIVDGNVRYTPNENFNGTDSFLYRTGDDQGATGAPVRVTVTVNAANDAPVGNPDSYATDEDSPITRDAPGVLSNDNDADGEEGLTVRLVDDVQSGALDLNENGSFTYTPRNNFNGRDSFTYVVVDESGAESDPVTVTLAVAVGNDAPGAEDDEASTQEDRSVSIDVLANDADPDDDALSIRDVDTPENGRAEVRNGGILYTPNANFFGTDTFEYTVVDADGATSTATVTVTVEPVNDAPLARDDAASTVEDTPLRLTQADLLGNDASGPPNENGQLRVTAVGNARNGTVRLDESGDVIFTPAPNYSGPASFVYTVTDNAGNTDTATANVDVTVDPVNDAPEAVNDRFDTGEDEPTTLDVLANDTDPEGELDPGSVEVVTAPQNGETTVNDDGTISYNPRANFNGTDTFVYRVCDAGNPRECDTATVEVVVGAANDAPTANDDAGTTGEDAPVTVDVLDNDEDPEGREDLDPLTVEVTSNPANGATSVDGGSITYRPNTDYNGPDAFTYRVCDTGTPQQCASATVEITVESANDDPTATADEARADEGGPDIFMDVLANDSADPDRGETLTVSRVTQPPNGQGTVEIVPEGQPNAGKLRFVPGADFNGKTAFNYTVSDGNGGTDTAAVTIEVAATNDDPTTANDTARAAEGGQPVRIDALGNDRAAPDEGETMMIVDFTQPPGGQGTVALEGGRLVYTPNDDYSGETTFTYTVDDGNGGRSTATVTVEVAPENDPPLARPDTRTTAEDIPLVLPSAGLTLNDAAGDLGQTLSVAEVGDAQNGTVELRGGQVVFTPAPDFSGEASFTYTACDDGRPQRCDTTTVAVSVTEVNDVPVAIEHVVDTPEDEPVVIDVGDGDRPGPAGESSQTLTVTEVTRPGNGTAEVVDGSVRYTPRENFNGQDTFVYTVCDDGNPRECDTATVTVNVGSVNDLLAAGNDTATTAEEEPVTIAVLGNDRDEDGLDRASVSVVTQPLHGATRVRADGSIRYTPRNGFSGTDTFQYRVCDRSDPAECATATVEVEVTEANDAPVAVDDEATTGAQEPVTIRALANDDDPEGRLDGGSVTITRGPSSGRVEVKEDGAIVYTPARDSGETVTFDYRVCDAEEPALCDTATVTVRVRPAPADPPRADIVVSTSAPARANIGQRFQYTLTVVNRGPDTSRNVLVRGILPRAVSFVSAPAGCNYTAGQRRLVCDLDDLADGASKTRKITVRADRAGTITLRGSVSSDTPDPITDNNNDAGG